MLIPTLRPRFPRRGVTLVEMLVAVALLVLMMTVIVQVFSAATGAVSTSRAFQEIDSSLRQLDSTIRTDLTNITARLTPPLDPKKNLGYFEYIENSFADNQGEDTDDCLRFTAKAPEGQLFTGRMYTQNLTGTGSTSPGYVSRQPITITSQYAEIIYFLRNGNLYRRVLLVAPDRQSSIPQRDADRNSPPFYFVGAFGGKSSGISVGWQGVNDLSAHPIATGPSGLSNIVLNTLSDLTNRENRFAYSRFANDFVQNGTATQVADARPDDENLDTVPDFYPSLYPSAAHGYVNSLTGNSLVNVPSFASAPINTHSVAFATIEKMAFPYLFPGAYSQADPSSLALAPVNALGHIHTPDPGIDQTTLAGLNLLNHGPIDIGDSLPIPSRPQTWWGNPTWRETMSPNWNDPYTLVQAGSFQPFGLSSTTLIYLPPMDNSSFSSNATPYRVNPQLFSDGAGSATFAALPGPFFTVANNDALWKQTWEDDLIAVGVRSFDVKAYDPVFQGYVDLGWGDDYRITTRQGAIPIPFNLIAGNGSGINPNTTGFPLLINWPVGTASFLQPKLMDSFAHEGRIPPLEHDFRLDSQFSKELCPSGDPSFNIGDDTANIPRLRRVWDSWSTDYSTAPASGVNPASGVPIGPPFTRPVYPSYPAPYPQSLRGLQIQIRMVDPRNERVKVLTIRQDFSDRIDNVSPCY